MELPEDLLAEIAWRSDPATLIRLAATCKLLHGTLNEPQFLRRYGLTSSRRRPSPIFVGAFVWLPGETDLSFVPSPAPVAHALSSKIRLNVSRGHGGYKPAEASRGGLVVLNSVSDEGDGALYVWNPVTGRTWSFPSPTVFGQELTACAILLDGDREEDEEGAAEPSFRLLSVGVMTDDEQQRVVHAQTLSRDDGEWGPAVATPDPGPSGGLCSVFDARRPRVLGGSAAVHWLCRWMPDDDTLSTAERPYWYYVLSYDVDAARAAILYVPPECSTDDVRPPGDLMLASSPDGDDQQLTLLVARGLEIRVWTLRGCGEAELAHRVEVDADAMIREMDWPPLRCEVELMQFVEATGVLVVRVADLGVLAVDLFQKAWWTGRGGTKKLDKTPPSSSSSLREVIKLTDDRHMHVHDINHVYVVPYEMDVLHLVPIPAAVEPIYLSELRFYNLDS